MRNEAAEQVLLDFRHWSDALRSEPSLSLLDAGLDRDERAFRLQTSKDLTELTNLAVVHLMRSGAPEYDRQSAEALLAAVDTARATVNRIIQDGPPEAILDLAHRAIDLASRATTRGTSRAA